MTHIDRPLSETTLHDVADAGASQSFRPSEYTGLLLQAVQSHAQASQIGYALELGVGCGVVLASLGLLGAQRLYGVDIDPDAVAVTQALLSRLDLADRAILRCGHLWDAVGDRTFDLVAANLPQFPTTGIVDLDRSPRWATGGDEGRALMDPFLAGLAGHLNPGGVALMTHSTIVGIAQTQRALAAQGLTSRTLFATQVRLGARKAALLDAATWRAHSGAGLLRVGPYDYIGVEMLEIRWA